MSVRPTKKGKDPRSEGAGEVEEIMDEMRKDGIEPDPQYEDGYNPAKDSKRFEDEDEEETPKPKPKAKKDPAPKGKKDDDQEEEDEDDDEDKDKKPKAKKEVKKDDADEDKDDEDSEDDLEDREKRPARFVEPWELTRLEKKMTKTLEGIVTQIKELVGKPDTKQTREQREDLADQIDDVKKIADEYGLDPEPLQKLADAILSKVKLPKDLSEKLESLEEIKEQRDQEQFWGKQDQLFDKEFGELRDSDEFSEELKQLSNDEIKALKAKLNELAFSKRYSGYSLVDLLSLKQDELLPEKKKTVVSGRGGQQRKNSGTDLSGDTELTAEQINDLSDEEFDAYSENMEKKHRAPLKRRGVPVR